MMTRTFALIFAAACASEASIEPHPEDPVPEGAGSGELYTGELCEVPADAEGACSLACDAVAVIEQYVPEGTCTIYECPLADGSTIRTGGCNL